MKNRIRSQYMVFCLREPQTRLLRQYSESTPEQYRILLALTFANKSLILIINTTLSIVPSNQRTYERNCRFETKEQDIERRG